MYSNAEWDDRYKPGKDAPPWDTGIPAPELVEYFEALSSKPARVLEIGCGSGTNAIWLAEQGCHVVATDFAPTAIASAHAKQKDSGTKVDFMVSDIIEKNPVSLSSIDFVFDRGVYHVMPPDMRRIFVDRVSEALDENGFWLSLAGNKDQNRPPEVEGPPQLTAIEVIEFAEVKFEVISLERASFILPGGAVHLAWKTLFRKRAVRS